MRPESALWKRIRPLFVMGKLDPIRVENPIHPGTPDVNICSGDWLELKTIPIWPRSGNIVQLQHFTPQQRVFLYRRWKYAPRSTHLLLEVRSTREYLLFWGDVAAKVVGRSAEAELRSQARVVLQAGELDKLARLFAQPAV